MSSGIYAREAECINDIRCSISATEFGYKIQALAAHVLLRLGCEITAINQFGHPDIIAVKDGKELHFEVEAEVGNPRLRQLTEADFQSLLNVRNVIGYYALAISAPKPYWVVVPAKDIVGRPPIPNILMEALSDAAYSEEWTREYVEMLRDKCRLIKMASFRVLSAMALDGRSL